MALQWRWRLNTPFPLTASHGESQPEAGAFCAGGDIAVIGAPGTPAHGRRFLSTVVVSRPGKKRLRLRLLTVSRSVGRCGEPFPNPAWQRRRLNNTGGPWSDEKKHLHPALIFKIKSSLSNLRRYNFASAFSEWLWWYQHSRLKKVYTYSAYIDFLQPVVSFHKNSILFRVYFVIFWIIFFSDYLVSATFYFKGATGQFPFLPVTLMQAADVRVWQTSLTEHESFRVLSVIGSLCLSGGMRSSVTGSGLKFVDTLRFSFTLRGITTMN